MRVSEGSKRQRPQVGTSASGHGTQPRNPALALAGNVYGTSMQNQLSNFRDFIMTEN